MDTKTLYAVGIGSVVGCIFGRYFLNTSASSSYSATRNAFRKMSPSVTAAPPGLAPTGMDVAGTHENRLLRKAETVIRQRTSQIVLVIERSVDTHNYSAIIRTAEALGIHHLYVVAPPDLDNDRREERRKKDLWLKDETTKKKHVAFAKKAGKWVHIHNFDTTEECLEALAKDGRELWVTELSQMAEDLNDILGKECPGNPLPQRLAVVFGSEGMGVSATMLEAADRRIYIKMRGFADSLNLSVSAALVMQRLILCDPSIIGNMSNAERAEIREEWYPRMARKEDQRARFMKLALEENKGNHVIAPYVDVRRPEDHRRVWLPKKTRKKLGAIGQMKYQGEIKTK